MTSPIPFIIILFFILLIRTQLRPKPLDSRIFIFPALLMLVGIYAAFDANVQAGEALSLFLGAILGAAVGLIQGKLVRVYEDHQTWLIEGSWLTVGVWLLSIPIRLLIKYEFVEMFHIHVELVGNRAYLPYLLSVSGILLGRLAMVTIRYPRLILSRI
jgi:hypothetical protein